MNNFEVYDIVVVVLKELSKGEVCTFCNIGEVIKYVSDKKNFEIENCMLFNGRDGQTPADWNVLLGPRTDF